MMTSAPVTHTKGTIMADVFIEDFEAPVKENPYAPVVAQLAKEDARRAAEANTAGEQYGTKARPEPVAKLVFGSEKEAKNALLKVQAAALDVERSARKVGDITVTGDEDAEQWVLRVKLADRRQRRSKEEIEAEKAAAEAKRQEKAEKAAKPAVAA